MMPFRIGNAGKLLINVRKEGDNILKDAELHQFLQLHGPMARDEIALQLGIPRTTIYEALLRLKNQNLVKREKYNNHLPGRSKILFQAIEKPIEEQKIEKLMEKLNPVEAQILDAKINPGLQLQLCGWCGGLVYSDNMYREGKFIFNLKPCYDSILRLRDIGHKPEQYFGGKHFLPIHEVSELLN